MLWKITSLANDDIENTQILAQNLKDNMDTVSIQSMGSCVCI